METVNLTNRNLKHVDLGTGTKNKNSKVVTNMVKTYNGPEPIKSGVHNVDYIVKNLAKGMIFERGDRTKFVIINADETSIIFQNLNPAGELITTGNETRRFSKQAFAELMIKKYFEPTTVARRESYTELAREFGLNRNFSK